MTIRARTSLIVCLALCAAFALQVAASADGGPIPTRAAEATAADRSDAVAQAPLAEPTPSPAADQGIPTLAPTLTPYIVTPVPTPESVLAAATQVLATRTWIAEHGTPTATPPNMVTATPTPRPPVVLNTPTPANAATATFEALLAQARAVTTGTPTPLPANAVTATPFPTAAPVVQPRPTATPILVPLAGDGATAFVWPTATPVPTPDRLPDVLAGKILFKSDRLGGTRYLAMNPDGSDVALLTGSWAYERVAEQESRSPDGRYLVYQATGGGGLDLFLRHLTEALPDYRLTQVGGGVCYDAAWSPDNYHIAFTANEEGNDEIYVVTRDGARERLTHNGWEWDKHPSYSPDGAQIVYWSSVGEGRKQIWVMNADGSGARNVSNSPANDWDPVWVKGLW